MNQKQNSKELTLTLSFDSHFEDPSSFEHFKSFINHNQKLSESLQKRLLHAFHAHQEKVSIKPKKRESIKLKVFYLMQTMPVVSTEQIATFFNTYLNPQKEASRFLKTLSDDDLIEGRRRKGKSKVWRLSRKGRNIYEAKKKPVPLKSNKLDHWLAIGDAFLSLYQNYNLQYFEPEYRKDFADEEDNILRFCPDAYFVINNQLYFLEVQRTKIPPSYWKYKWDYASRFLKSRFYNKETFHPRLNDEQPIFIALSLFDSSHANSILNDTSGLHVYTISNLNEWRDVFENRS